VLLKVETHRESKSKSYERRKYTKVLSIFFYESFSWGFDSMSSIRFLCSFIKIVFSEIIRTDSWLSAQWIRRFDKLTLVCLCAKIYNMISCKISHGFFKHQTFFVKSSLIVSTLAYKYNNLKLQMTKQELSNRTLSMLL